MVIVGSCNASNEQLAVTLGTCAGAKQIASFGVQWDVLRFGDWVGILSWPYT